MMLGQVPPYLVDLGKIVGIAAGLAAGFTVLAKSPIGKLVAWLYRQLFGEPAGLWLRAQVGAVVDEKLLRRNGGTTVPDAIRKIDELRSDTRQMHKANVQRLERLEERVAALAPPPKETP